jgi:hypothetical protein
VDLEPLRGLPLTSLSILDEPARRPKGRSLAFMADLPQLAEVTLSGHELADRVLPEALPTVSRVNLYYVADDQPLELLAEVFPALETLWLCVGPSGCGVIDLRGLSGLPGLHVTVEGDVELLGADDFPPDRLTVRG